MKEKLINKLIKILKVDTNKVSDGYHTLGELYDHRCQLWVTLAKRDHKNFWKSRTHYTGEGWDGWFILGTFTEQGKQITYHLPESLWDQLELIEELNRAPKWDGHTSKDVLERLRTL